MPKQTYTIGVCYFLPHYNDVEVEADSIEEACRLALDEADDDPNWRPCDEPMPSYVDGIYVGKTPTGRYWDKPDDAPDDPPIPIPFDELNAMYDRSALCHAVFGVLPGDILDFIELVAAGNTEFDVIEGKADDLLTRIQSHLKETP